ncbi:hypothetical protein ACJX0J_008292 [Zea mays]
MAHSVTCLLHGDHTSSPVLTIEEKSVGHIDQIIGPVLDITFPPVKSGIEYPELMAVVQISIILFSIEALELIYDLFEDQRVGAADLVASAAIRSRCHYVNKKWFSGMLTNWSITKTRLSPENRSKSLLIGLDESFVVESKNLSVWAWMFLFGHLVRATGLMFLISWHGRLVLQASNQHFVHLGLSLPVQ